MNAVQAVVLGLIQGLTEFLPVSSSGHLSLGSYILKLPAPGMSLSVLLHLGTALATVVMLWKEISWLFLSVFAPKKDGERSRALGIIGLLAAASVPGAIVGVFFGDFVDAVFGSRGVAAAGLIVTGFILRFGSRARSGDDGRDRVRRRRPRREATSAVAGGDDSGSSAPLGTVDLRRAMIVGVCQAVAIIPGISRSGTTITAGLVSGMDREDAARFSFLLALPAVFGGALLDYRKVAAAGEPAFSAMGVLGAAVAFIAGIFALSAVFRVVRKGDISKFSYYCWAVGILALAWFLIMP